MLKFHFNCPLPKKMKLWIIRSKGSFKMLQVGSFLHLKQQLLIVINILYMYLLKESDARYSVTLENVYLSTQMVEKT